MNVLKKRVCAYAVDALLFCAILLLLQHLLKQWAISLKSLHYLVAFVPFFCRDLIFRNASIGKRIMGLRVLDNDWKAPRFFTMVKRGFLTTTVGYVMFLTARARVENQKALFDWEKNVIGTRVIDKKVWRELEQKASALPGHFPKNMADLYDQYLASTLAR